VLEIRLLGEPRILRGGNEVRPPRGQKAWGLLAYLLLSEVRDPSRQRLAELFFAQANDPLQALRWNLAELRRVLGEEVLASGGTTLVLTPGTHVDVQVLLRATPQEALALTGIGRELLEGMNFASSPGFDGWIAHERRRLLGAACSALHEAALDRLADRRPSDALPLARRLVELDAYDENFRELLVRTLAQAGDAMEARRAAATANAFFQAELGRDISPTLDRAMGEQALDEEPPSTRLSVQHAAAALIEAGEAAAGAGAVDTGVQSMRRAVHLTQEAGDERLEARALLALGSTLVHGVRGRDEEGSALLRRAAFLAAAADLSEIRAAAVRELSYVDALAGRYARCARGLAEAASLATSNSEMAAIETVSALAAADLGSHSKALRHAERAHQLALADGDGRRAAYARTLSSRSQLLTANFESALKSVDEALRLVGETEWLAFAAWPESVRAELYLLDGKEEDARDRMEYAFALACEFRDPCWEGLTCRGLGLIAERAGDTASALRRLEDARQRAGRTSDSWRWGEAYALEAYAGAAVRAGCSARARVGGGPALAGRTHRHEGDGREGPGVAAQAGRCERAPSGEGHRGRGRQSGFGLGTRLS
jgi:DNA-binding SARP family transcriptional activator